MSDQTPSRQVVAVRVRPLIKRELKNNSPIHWKTSEQEITRISTDSNPTHYVFDRVIGPSENNEDVYCAVAKDIVCGAIQGINGTIFAYGQTSSGKTFTMLGAEGQPGLIRYGIDEIFQLVEQAKERMFLISMSYLEIYNEEVKDLLTGESNMKIRESEEGSIYVENCGQQLVEKPDDVFRMMAEGDKLRHVGATNMNEMSSRSHAIATLYIESKLKDDDEDCAVLVAQLNFVDLAGSEKAGQTGAVGQRLKEGGHINASLLALSHCINKLAEAKSGHVPYRDSKLTRLLQNSIGGNSRTAIVANVTPASIDETISTLRFASRAKKVQSKPVVNEVVDDRTLTRRLEKRVKELEQQLAQKTTLDTTARQGLLKELLKPQKQEDRPAKSRRQTWCPGPGRKAGLPLLDLSANTNSFDNSAMDLDNNDTSAMSSGMGAFKRPAPPCKVTNRRKRPAYAPATDSLPEEEEFGDPREKLEGRKSDPTDLTSASPPTDTEMQQLKNTIIKLQAENAELMSKTTDLDSIKHELESSNSKVLQLECTKTDLESKLSAAEPNEDIISEKNKTAIEILSEELSVLKEKLVEYGSLEAELNQLKVDHGVKDEALLDVRRQLLESEESSQKAAKALAEFQEAQCKQSEELADLREKLRITSEDDNTGPAELETRNAELAERVEQLLSTVEDLRKLAGEADIKIQEKDSVLESLRSEQSEVLKKIQEDTLNMIQEKDAEIERLKLSSLQSGEQREDERDQEMRDNLRETKESLEKAQTEVERLEKAQQESVDDLRTKEEELEHLRALISDSETKVSTESAGSDNTYEELIAKTEQLQKSLDDQRVEQCEEVRKIQANYESIIQERDAEVLRMRVVEESGEKPEDDVLKLTDILQDRESEIAELKVELESSQKKSVQLKQELDSVPAQQQDTTGVESSTAVSNPDDVRATENDESASQSMVSDPATDSKLEEKDAVIAELKEDLNLARESLQDIDDLSSEIDILRMEKNEIVQQKDEIVEAKLAEISELRAELVSVKEKLTESESKSVGEVDEADVLSLRQQLEEMRTALDGNEALSSELDIVKMEKQEIVRMKEEEISALNETLDGMKQRIEELELMSSELDVLKMEKNEILQLKEAEIADLNSKLTDIQSQETSTSEKTDEGLLAELEVLRSQAIKHADLTVSLSHRHLVEELEALKEACREQQSPSIPTDKAECPAEETVMDVGVTQEAAADTEGDPVLETTRVVNAGSQESSATEGALSTVKTAQADVESRDSTCQTDHILNFEKLLNYKEELEDAEKGLELRDTRIRGLERGYEQLNKEYNELIEFSNMEKEVYSCRTPGQVKEKQLLNRLSDAEKNLQITEAQYKMEVSHLRSSSNNLAEENYRLKQKLGEAPPSATKRFLSPLHENSPDIKPADISLNSEAMPDLMLTLTESPEVSMLRPTKLNLSDNGESPATGTRSMVSQGVDAGTNTDMDFKWFEMDDTILGIVKTGAANKTLSAVNKTFSPEDTSIMLQTPAKNLVCEVKTEVAEFKSGLEMAYGMIKDLQAQHDRDDVALANTKQDLKDKQTELEQLRLVLSEVNGLEEKHELHLTELNARHKEEKLSLQIDYQTQIEAKTAEHEVLIQALKSELSHLQESQQQNAVKHAEYEQLEGKHYHQITELQAAHHADIESIQIERATETLALQTKHQTVLDQLKSDLQSHHQALLEELRTAHLSEVGVMREAHKAEIESIEEIHKETREELLKLTETLDNQESQSKDDQLQKEHTLAVEEIRSCHEQEKISLQAKYEQERTTLQQEFELKLEASVVNNGCEMNALRQEIIQLKQAVGPDPSISQSGTQEADSLRESLKTSTTELNTLKESHQALSAELETLRKSYEVTTKRLESLELSQGTGESEFSQLQQSYQTKAADLVNLTELHQATTAVLENLRESHNTLMMELEEIKKSDQRSLVDIENLKLANQAVLKEREELSVSHQAATLELENLKATHQQIVDSLTQKSNTDLASLRVTLKTNLESVTAKHQSKIEMLQQAHAEGMEAMKSEQKKELEASKNSQTEEELKLVKLRLESTENKLREMESTTVAASQLTEKEQELDVFMEKALVDRRQLAEKYKEARDKLKELEQKPAVSKQGSSIIATLHEKTKREKKLLELRVAKLEKKLDNPEGQVKQAKDMEKHYKNESERYHDELTQIDHLVQKFAEEYFGFGDWYFKDLVGKLRNTLPESLKQSAAKSMAAHPRRWVGGSPPPSPKKVEDKGVLCDHLRKRQHMKIVQLESDKAGLECEAIKLKKENKQIDKLHSEIHELKQQHYNLKQEHQKLQDLFGRTEEELIAARENALPTIPNKSQSSLFGKVAPTDINIQLKIKGLEYEKYSLTQKNKELESTLSKLRDKYIVLRDKYDRVAADGSRLQSSTIIDTSTLSTTSQTQSVGKSAGIKQPPAVTMDPNHGNSPRRPVDVKREPIAPTAAVTNINLDETENCNTQ